MEVELRHMRAFVAVAEEGHFGRAASRLHITQPPLSRQIRDLEQELGTQLIDRSRRPIRLTAAGRIFLEQARLTLAQARRGVERSREAGVSDIAELRVAALLTAFNGALPSILRAFRARSPEVSLETTTTTPELQADALRDDTFDIALTQWIVDSRGLNVEPLLEERRIALVPEDHPLADRAALTLEELAHEPFIAPCPVCMPNAAEDQAAVFRARGLTRLVAQEACGMLQQLALVSSGLGMALSLDSIGNVRRDGVALVALEPDIPTAGFFLLWRRGDEREQVRTFLDTAREVVHALESRALPGARPR